MTNENNDQIRAWPSRVVAVLNKENTVIVVDDHCYALRNWVNGEWKWSAWIFHEALNVLKTLPENPDDAERVRENVEYQPNR